MYFQNSYTSSLDRKRKNYLDDYYLDITHVDRNDNNLKALQNVHNEQIHDTDSFDLTFIKYNHI